MDCWVNLLIWASAWLKPSTSRIVYITSVKKISLLGLKFWIGTGVLVNPKICSDSYETNTKMLVFISLSWIGYWISWVRVDWIIIMHKKIWGFPQADLKVFANPSTASSTFSVLAPDLLLRNQQQIFCVLLVFQKSHKCCPFASAPCISTPFLPLAKTNNLCCYESAPAWIVYACWWSSVIRYCTTLQCHTLNTAACRSSHDGHLISMTHSPQD